MKHHSERLHVACVYRDMHAIIDHFGAECNVEPVSEMIVPGYLDTPPQGGSIQTPFVSIHVRGESSVQPRGGTFPGERVITRRSVASRACNACL